jgi:hypothetical protein
MGIVAAVVIDSAAIAREDVPKPPPNASLRPIVMPHAKGFDVGLIGTF